uniref:Uncharacterized protein n=1 Tax=Tanacetum cinerariifolium TaxID=118510 RepID=A0A6L2MYS6_TANCI|nr:hypothetical protein [Tanacetum cinerariifolium]
MQLLYKACSLEAVIDCDEEGLKLEEEAECLIRQCIGVPKGLPKIKKGALNNNERASWFDFDNINKKMVSLEKRNTYVLLFMVESVELNVVDVYVGSCWTCVWK